MKKPMNTEDFKHTVLPLRNDIKRFALKLTGTEDDAEDLVQEVMLRLWSMRDRLTGDGKTKSLALTITRNIHYDNCRHNKFHVRNGSLKESAVENPTVEINDEVELIRRIVEHLPPIQQQIFWIKEIEGYESEELIAITGCSADNLRKNLSRARIKIRDTYLNIMKGVAR